MEHPRNRCMHASRTAARATAGAAIAVAATFVANETIAVVDTMELQQGITPSVFVLFHSFFRSGLIHSFTHSLARKLADSLI